MFSGRRHTLSFLFVITLLTLSLMSLGSAEAKRVLRDPDAPSAEEAKVLGWGPVKTPNRGKSPEYLIRGVVLDINDSQTKRGKDWYDIKVLPIEVLNNHQRVITFDHFQNGITLTLNIPKPRFKELKKGQMVEYNQYYTESVEQSIGGAKMVAMTLHKDIQGYPAGAGAYLKKPGFYPIQYKNALKALKMYAGNVQSDPEFKNHVDYLATKSKDSELKTIAKATFLEMYSSEPSGQCKVNKTTDTISCP